MTFAQLVHLISLLGGLAAVAFAYMFIPAVTSALAVPLRSMRPDKNTMRDVAVCPPSHYLSLWLNYALGSLLFLVTGGNLAQANLAVPVTDVAQQLAIISLTAGLIIVAMVRIECVFHTQDLLDSFQQIVIAAIGISVVLVVVKFEALSELQQFGKYWLLNANGFLYVFVGSLCTAFFVEYLIHWMSRQPAFRRVPYDLLRQRIESNELLEHEWDATEVIAWTVLKINQTIGNAGVKSVCWLTETMPETVMDAINQAIVTRSINHPDEHADQMRQRVRVLTRNNHSEPAWLGGHALKEQVDRLDRLTPFRIRLLIINERVALLSFPSRKVEGALGEGTFSSDCAALVDDPVRVATFQSWFDNLWDQVDRTPTA